jgi:TPR repeat protein
MAAAEFHDIAQDQNQLCYVKGYGVAHHDVKAAEYFRMSMDQGHAAAQIGLRLYLSEAGSVFLIETRPRHISKWHLIKEISWDKPWMGGTLRLGLAFHAMLRPRQKISNSQLVMEMS